jgi:parvulin-like peptidyl-prolyl isomerase
MARRKAAADGIDFDEKVREQNRTYLVQIFYQKKVFPKVQVTADDMRRYYDQHLSTEFSESDQAQFRLIRIDVKKMGGRDQAIDKIKDLHEKAARGDDFAKLASGINSDPNLMKTGGRVGGTDGWVQRGAFAIPEVEAAVWKLQPGQVTDVIQVGDSFYIAKLEDRKLGRVRPFEDEDVQKQIRDTLQRQQIAERREQVQAQLMKEAVIYPYPPELEPAIEIAMQKYPQWSTATK